MNYKLEDRDILFNDEQLGPYPDHLLKRVDAPTNSIPGSAPQPDKPIDFGLQEYCKKCGICAKNCRGGAISEDNELVEYNGYAKFKMDYVRCTTLQRNIVNGSNCGRCTVVCPWHRPDSTPADFKDWDGDIRFLHDSADARAACLCEHNYADEEYKTRKWWFDLVENEDGDLVIPDSSKYTVISE